MQPRWARVLFRGSWVACCVVGEGGVLQICEALLKKKYPTLLAFTTNFVITPGFFDGKACGSHPP